jgi:nucleotide-binding universal stress UspA family protein
MDAAKDCAPPGRPAAVPESRIGRRRAGPGAGLASEFKSKLTLLHVVPRLDSPGEGHYADEWRRRLLADASEEIAKVQQSAGIHVEAVVESGDVSKAVRTAAGRLNADLVVIGRGAADNARLRTHASALSANHPVRS